jgi:thiol-disulfide isomerase/thioredoxin
MSALLSPPQFVHADTQLNSFETHSYKTIVTKHQGNSFLMVLWSVDCPPCIEELPVLGSFHQSHPDAAIVMVSTDSKNQQEDILRLMKEHGLNDVQQWVFDGDSVAATRYAIDPMWYGELPRSYFHLHEDKRMVKSGKLDENVLSAWIKTINNKIAGL